MNRIVKRLAVPLSAAAVLGTAGFAYMASNSVPVTHAGSGQAAVSGYVVSGVTYQTHMAGDVQYVSGVTFTLNHAAKNGNVQAFAYNSDNQYVQFSSCNQGQSVNASATTFTCKLINAAGEIPGGHMTTHDVTRLVVDAAQ